MVVHEESNPPWKVGQVVSVQERTWPGMNRLGGIGVITKVVMDSDDSSDVRLDIKYTVGRQRDKNVESSFVELLPTNNDNNHYDGCDDHQSNGNSSPRRPVRKRRDSPSALSSKIVDNERQPQKPKRGRLSSVLSNKNNKPVQEEEHDNIDDGNLEEANADQIAPVTKETPSKGLPKKSVRWLSPLEEKGNFMNEKLDSFVSTKIALFPQKPALKASEDNARANQIPSNAKLAQITKKNTQANSKVASKKQSTKKNTKAKRGRRSSIGIRKAQADTLCAEDARPSSWSDRIQTMYNAIQELWPQTINGSSIAKLEGIDSCILAHQYMESWAPKGNSAVRLMILAESHAATLENILGTRLAEETMDDEMASITGLLKSHHFGHLNVVHCPTYGESWALDMDESLQKNCQGALRGTPQFWRVLSTLAGDLDSTNLLDLDVNAASTTEIVRNYFAAIEDKKSDTSATRSARIRSKLAIKKRLMERGIMLADVSPVPLYTGGGVEKMTNQTTGNQYTSKTNKLPIKDYNAVVRAAWDHYASHLIEKYQPELVLVFGKRVERAIGESSLQETVAAHHNNGLYLGSIQHPSYNAIQGRYILPTLQVLKVLATAVSRKKRKIGGQTLDVWLQKTLVPTGKKANRSTQDLSTEEDEMYSPGSCSLSGEDHLLEESDGQKLGISADSSVIGHDECVETEAPTQTQMAS